MTTPDQRAAVQPLDCPDCGTAGALVLAPKPEAWRGASRWIYRCTTLGCRGLLSAHPDGRPMGDPADAETRRARRLTHALLDPLWRRAFVLYGNVDDARQRRRICRTARQRTYAYLAAHLDLAEEQCHVSRMDIPTLRLVYALLRRTTPAAIRAWAKARESRTEEGSAS